MTALTAHFTREELRIDTAPTAYRDNLVALASLLEAARDAGGGLPLRITSTYRSVARNYLVGGSPTSQHLDGTGADGVPIGITPDTWVRRVAANLPGATFGQLIAEGDHFHISLPTRGVSGQVLLKRADGTFANLSGAVVELPNSESGTSSVTLLLLVVALLVLLTLTGKL